MIDALLRLFGIQPQSYRVLVRTFWRMSMRQPMGLTAQNVGKSEGAAWKGWLLYVFFGLMVSTLALTGLPRPIYGTIVAMGALVLIGMSVVSDFAVFVMSPGDDEILFHRPIRSQTYLGARLTVAGMHVSILALCFGLLPALTSLVRYGPLYAPLLLLTLVATALFALLIGFGVYRTGLKWFGSQRLEAALTYLPALFSILLFVLPQLMIGSLRGDATARVEPVLDFLPPAWFAAVPEALLGNHAPRMLLRATLGLALLPLGYWILIAAMGRGFLRDLQGMIASRGVGRASDRADGSAVRGSGRAERHPEWAAGYLLCLGAMRSRDSRTRAAPILLMPVAFLLLGIFRTRMSAFGGTTAIYMLGAGSGTLLLMTAFHEHFRAAWFYGSVPIAHYGRFLSGVVSAVLLRYVLPVFLLVCFVALLHDPSWLTLAGCVHGILGGLLSIPFLLGHLKHPPFSAEFQQSEQTAQMGIYFLSMMLVGIAGGVHVLVAMFAPWAFLLTIPTLLWLNLTWLRSVLRRYDAKPPAPVRAAGLGGRRPRAARFKSTPAGSAAVALPARPGRFSPPDVDSRA